ncbi:Uncharacterized protein FKW44_022532 [Caligus rogercresseyi]|uniref:Uncharacterized protein n=1 Tax=Caligus rogercresseyi TaxID=217165 RepID=A0A7T8GN54_CALRO|nr:Uncharacterized protein FKW44_022532 [Caligus rogercresseyi]
MEHPFIRCGPPGVPGAGDGLLGQGLVAPQSPDANTLDYVFWPHIDSKACKFRSPNITALKTPSTRMGRHGRELHGQGFQEAPHGHCGRQRRVHRMKI